MKNMTIKAVIAGLSLLLALLSQSLAAQEESKYQEGLHYFVIDGAPEVLTEGMELVEAFSYLCTHCNTFEPYIQSWVEGRKPDHVGFRRIPVIFGRNSWELYARGYVTAEMLGITEEAHQALMDQLWKKKEILRNMDQLAAFYAQFGVDKDKFIATSRSFAVDGKMRREQLAVQEWGIRGTPALVLNGRYRIQAGAAVPNYETMLNIVDYLIERDADRLPTEASPEGEAAD